MTSIVSLVQVQRLTTTVRVQRATTTLWVPHLSAQTPEPVNADVGDVGAGVRAAREDHKHQAATAAPAQGIGSGNREGVAPTLARSDHDHALRETGGPTDLTLGAVADGQVLQRSGAQIVGVAPSSLAVHTVSSTGYDGDPNIEGAPAILVSAAPGAFYLQQTPFDVLWRKTSYTSWVAIEPRTHDVFTTYANSATGDDTGPGTSTNPIASLKELSARCLALDSLQHHATLSGNDFRTHDWKVDGYNGFSEDTPTTTLGGSIRPTQILGTSAIADTFTVGSTTGLTITASPSPGWVVNQWVRHVLKLEYYGFVYWAPIIANGVDTLTVNFGWNTLTGAFFPVPTPGTTLEIHEIQTRILPPLTNPSWASSALHYHGQVLFRHIHFDGTGGGGSGLRPRAVSECTIDACLFTNYSLLGWLGGPGYIRGCYFDACGDVCIEGQVQVNDTHVKGTRTGYRGKIQVGAGSVITAEDLTGELYHAKAVDNVINDEAVAYRLVNVRDLMLISRGGRFQKVNQPMRTAEGLGAVNRYLVNLDGGQNRVDLLDTANADLSAGTAYIRLEALAQNLSKADYAADGYQLDDSVGNWVFDGGSY